MLPHSPTNWSNSSHVSFAFISSGGTSNTLDRCLASKRHIPILYLLEVQSTLLFHRYTKQKYCYSHRCHLSQSIHIFFIETSNQVTTSSQNPYSDQNIIKTRLRLTRLHYHLTSRIIFCIHHCNPILLTLISTWHAIWIKHNISFQKISYLLTGCSYTCVLLYNESAMRKFQRSD